ncbi:RNA polymerase sigma factor [Fulvivirga ligni]|uniref:RNA polymerase sigma factor n=1 Tax=Fulvivirga ligni TaxID=2904246 RepID=UPI001F2A5E3C|nr:sigma-70 family RNA polymerase sigma factor [Fulvivirga ligni]UII22721.1 sigma-70 family RNA polymerase sigma factor [Fulvivirga ligni]
MQPVKKEFVDIIEKHKGIIYKICNGYCKEADDREDLVQDVIGHLWKAYPKYNADYKLSTWIYRIALNVAISYYRKEQTRKKYIQPIQEHTFEVSEQPENENIKLLNQFIAELDELNKALMILYLDGNSHKEIAEILNISESNVGTKISRIKIQLKEKFNNLK